MLRESGSLRSGELATRWPTGMPQTQRAFVARGDAAPGHGLGSREQRGGPKGWSPRGLPPEASPQTAVFLTGDIGDHSRTWFTLTELQQVD